MRKILLLIGTLALACSLVLTGCGVNSAVVPTPTPYTSGNEPPITQTWISPGKVQVGNFYPGARAEWPITIHNGNDYQATFEVKYRYPDKVADGYAYPTAEVQDWVIIADPTPVLAPYDQPGSTKEIMVVLAMPNDAVAPGQHWEFWISVKDATQAGLVTTELCSRWQIVMR